MPSAGIHGFTGLLFAGYIENPYAKLGMILGSILPDADLIVSSVVYLITGKVDAGKKIHRTWSHSWLVHASFFIIGIIFFYLYNIQFNIAYYHIGFFLIALACMMMLHSLLDYLYIGYMTASDAEQNIAPGVALWLPMTSKKYALWPQVFSQQSYNIITAIDFLPDPLFFAGLTYLHLVRYGIIIQSIIFVAISFIFFCVFVGFFIYALKERECASDSFVVAIHYPGVFFLGILLIIPILFCDTIRSFFW